MLKSFPKEPEASAILEFQTKAVTRQNMWASNPVKKIKAREEKALELSAIEYSVSEQPALFKSNTQ